MTAGPDEIDHAGDDILSTARRGTVITLGGQVAKLALQMLSIVVMARLLSPADFGMLAMVAVVSGFVVSFSDLGLAAATVQRDQMTPGQLSTLFWINGSAGLVLGLAALALAPALAWFFRDPRLTPIASVLSANYVLAGLGVQHRALLTRQMRYAALSTVDLTALIVSVACGIPAALGGLGYWALVVQQVTAQAALLGGLWIASGWRPGIPSRDPALRSMFSLAGYLTGFNVVNYAVRNMDNLLIGWRWGAAPLGLYEKAYNLLLLPIQVINGPLTTVAVPTLSRLRDRPDEYRIYYQRAVAFMVKLGMPIIVFAFVAADDLVLVLLGPRWNGASLLFRALAPGAMVGTFNVATGWVYLSLGTTSRQFRFGAFVAVLMVLAFALGLPWGAVGVAAAFSIVTCAVRYPAIVYCFRGTPLAPSDLAGVLWRPLVAALCAGAVAFAVTFVLPATGGRLGVLLLQAGLFSCAYALTLRVFGVLPLGLTFVRRCT